MLVDPVVSPSQIGRIVVRNDCGMFKLSVVLGPSRTAGKVRVRTWQNSTQTWSHPFAILPHWLQAVDENLNGVPLVEAVRRRRVVNRALESSPNGSGRKGWL